MVVCRACLCCLTAPWCHPPSPPYIPYRYCTIPNNPPPHSLMLQKGLRLMPFPLSFPPSTPIHSICTFLFPLFLYSFSYLPLSLFSPAPPLTTPPIAISLSLQLHPFAPVLLAAGKGGYVSMFRANSTATASKMVPLPLLPLELHCYHYRYDKTITTTATNTISTN